MREEWGMSKEVEFCNRDRFIELGLVIASLRKMQGLSQEKLAEKAKISRSHLSSIEAPNIVRPFSLEVLYNIADALGVRAGDFFPIWQLLVKLRNLLFWQPCFI